MRRAHPLRLVLLFAIVVLAASVFPMLSDPNAHQGSEPTSTATAQPAPAVTGDYYEVTGPAEIPYSLGHSGIEYCPLDELGRATCVYGELTVQSRQDAKDHGRQDILVDPAGWPDANAEVTIPALSSVEGSADYHGWFWNRSHLLADSLGGDPVAENLVTGTRMQNVGSVNNSGGMAYPETLARNYLDSSAAINCPLYYAATPNYSGDELVPRSVSVDVLSCDESISQHVEVQNIANGFDINYADGSWTQD